MATVFNWEISQLNCYPQADGQTDVVFVVHWTCSGTDGTYNGSVYSTCSVTYEAGTPYTPYADLTQDQVLGWIWANGVDQASAEAAVQTQINNQINPPVVSPPLPWVN
jgi:hypothetical protein